LNSSLFDSFYQRGFQEGANAEYFGIKLFRHSPVDYGVPLYSFCIPDRIKQGITPAKMLSPEFAIIKQYQALSAIG
jgi:hypothetical protein